MSTIPKRDMTDSHLRRVARVLGYRGRDLPLAITDLVVHPNRPADFTLLCYDGERRRDAAERLRKWAWPEGVSLPHLFSGAR